MSTIRQTHASGFVTPEHKSQKQLWFPTICIEQKDVPVPPIERRKLLKAATAPIHERLDMSISRSSALRTLSGYRAYLCATFDARAELEHLLDTSNASLIYPVWPDRKIADALDQDIRDLGANASAPTHVDRQPLTGGGVYGALYVLEGAAIGARLIARRAAELGAHAQFGARHLSSQISQPEAFSKFLNYLEAAELDAPEEQRCVETAIYAFERFERSYAGLV